MTTNDQTNNQIGNSMNINGMQADGEEIIPINSIGLKSLKKKKMMGIKENSISIEDNNSPNSPRQGLMMPALP